MGVFGIGKKTIARLDAMDATLHASFSRVKMDIEAAYAWVNYFQKQNAQLQGGVSRLTVDGEEMVRALRKQQRMLESREKEIEELKALPRKVESLAIRLEASVTEEKLNSVMERISQDILQIDRRFAPLQGLPATVQDIRRQLHDHLQTPHTSTAVERRVEELQEKLSTLVLKKAPKDKLVEKVAKQNHDYLKAMVLSYVKKYEKISAFQLREMVVEEQNLTSKSTFYRIMEEIEEEDGVGIIRQGKEKVYLFKHEKLHGR